MKPDKEMICWKSEQSAVDRSSGPRSDMRYTVRQPVANLSVATDETYTNRKARRWREPMAPDRGVGKAAEFAGIICQAV